MPCRGVEESVTTAQSKLYQRLISPGLNLGSEKKKRNFMTKQNKTKKKKKKKKKQKKSKKERKKTKF